MADTILDLSGLQCPMPILKTKKAVATMPKGATIEVLATDPGAPGDFAAWCTQSRNTLVESTEAGGVFRFLIQHTAA
jgi:tRNA 2-thiouridine synthesizing protein A